MFILAFRSLLLAISLALGFGPAYAASINVTVERVASNLPGAASNPNGPVVRIRWEAVADAELYEVTWDNLGTHLTVRPTTALWAIDNQPADQGKTYKVTAKKGAETLATGSVKGGAKGQASQTSTGGLAQPESPLGTVATSGTIKYTSPDLSPLFKSREYETFGDYLTDLVKVAMVLSVVAATLVVVYAGFSYLTSGGSPEATAKGKEMIGGALIGLATVFLAAVFLVSLYSPEALAPPPEARPAIERP